MNSRASAPPALPPPRSRRRKPACNPVAKPGASTSRRIRWSGNSRPTPRCSARSSPARTASSSPRAPARSTASGYDGKPVGHLERPRADHRLPRRHRVARLRRDRKRPPLRARTKQSAARLGNAPRQRGHFSQLPRHRPRACLRRHAGGRAAVRGPARRAMGGENMGGRAWRGGRWRKPGGCKSAGDRRSRLALGRTGLGPSHRPCGRARQPPLRADQAPRFRERRRHHFRGRATAVPFGTGSCACKRTDLSNEAPLEQWFAPASNEVTSSPGVSKAAVVFSDGKSGMIGRRLHYVSSATGMEEWSASITPKAYGFACLTPDAVIAEVEPGSLTSFDLRGRVRWHRSLGSPTSGSYARPIQGPPRDYGRTSHHRNRRRAGRD